MVNGGDIGHFEELPWEIRLSHMWGSREISGEQLGGDHCRPTIDEHRQIKQNMPKPTC